MTGLHLLKGSDLCVPVAFCHYKQNQLVGLDIRGKKSTGKYLWNLLW